MITIPGNSETDVAVRVAGRIVQIQREHTSIAAIVPVAATNERTSTFRPDNRNQYTLEVYDRLI